MDIWLQSYKKFISIKNNVKQNNLTSFFANFSKTISPTSNSFLLIMSHITIKLRPYELMNIIAQINNIHSWWAEQVRGYDMGWLSWNSNDLIILIHIMLLIVFCRIPCHAWKVWLLHFMPNSRPCLWGYTYGKINTWFIHVDLSMPLYLTSFEWT